MSGFTRRTVSCSPSSRASRRRCEYGVGRPRHPLCSHRNAERALRRACLLAASFLIALEAGALWLPLRSAPVGRSFFVHDLGYWGQPNRTAPRARRIPSLARRSWRKLFGDEWGDFCLLHSRYYSKRLGRATSKLCLADKLVFVMNRAGFTCRACWRPAKLEFIPNAQAAALSAEPMTDEERADFATGEPYRWHPLRAPKPRDGSRHTGTARPTRGRGSDISPKHETCTRLPRPLRHSLPRQHPDGGNLVIDRPTAAMKPHAACLRKNESPGLCWYFLSLRSGT